MSEFHFSKIVIIYLKTLLKQDSIAEIFQERLQLFWG